MNTSIGLPRWVCCGPNHALPACMAFRDTGSALCLVHLLKEQTCCPIQWYPIASEMDLDPSRPHQMMLLGETCK